MQNQKQISSQPQNNQGNLLVNEQYSSSSSSDSEEDFDQMGEIKMITEHSSHPENYNYQDTYVNGMMRPRRFSAQQFNEQENDFKKRFSVQGIQIKNKLKERPKEANF